MPLRPPIHLRGAARGRGAPRDFFVVGCVGSGTRANPDLCARHLGSVVRSVGVYQVRRTQVVVPLVVISELEAKRHHHELGWFAREALRMFDDLRLEHGRLDQPIPVGSQGGTLHVELNHSDPACCPPASDGHQRRPHPDVRRQPRRRGQARHVGQQGHSAAGQGRRRSDCRPTNTARRMSSSSGWTGMAELDVTSEEIDAPVLRRRDRTRGGAKPAMSHRDSAAGRQLPRAGPGQPREADAAGPGRPGGVRPARPLSRAARRAGPAARRDRWASCRWAERPAPASRRWHCAPAWKPCWNAARSARSSFSVRCTPSVARSWATCPAVRATRWGRGRRRCSTRWKAWPVPRSSRRCSRAGCWKCCR